MGSFLFKDITAIDGTGRVREHAWIGVREGRIAYLEEKLDDEVCASQEAPGIWDEVYDGRGRVLMPGFYNAHAHVPMTLLRGRGEGLALDAWLNQAIFPFEDYIDHDAAYWATQLGIAEMVRFGTVSFSDMYYHSDARAQAVLESGIKCNLGHSIVCFDQDATFEDLPAYSIMNHLVDAYHGAGDGRLLVDANLHAEYTSTPRVARGLAEYAREKNLRMQVHVSETASEVAGCKERHHNLTPVQYLADCGIFDTPATAAHCVWLEGDDPQILAEHGVYVAANPASNAKLGSGIADLDILAQSGVTIALGTDGVASNNNHDMQRSMYLMALLQRARACDPVGFSPTELVSIATLHGAQAQGRSDCGVIEMGAHADLCVFDFDTLWAQPIQDYFTNLVYSAEGQDVLLTMIDGVVVYKEGAYPTIDVERAVAETKRHREKILGLLDQD